MNIIGHYNKQNDDERVIELAFNRFIKVVKNPNIVNDKSPNLLLFSGDINIGSLWKKTSKNGNQYLSGNLLLPSYEKAMINVLFGKEHNIVVVVEEQQKGQSNEIDDL